MQASVEQGRVAIRLPLEAANKLATVIIKHAEDMPSAALDLANLVRGANYAAHDSFALPPDERPSDSGDDAEPAQRKRT